MKKTLRIMFILLVLAGGFLYIVKNPELPISQNILTTLGIDMSTDEGTGVDLTNCLSYFDGCNTCMVSGGVIGGCTKMFCQEPAEPQCLEYVWTGMDLSGCVSYFDGCNNCTVENGKPSACTEMYCETPSEPKCNEYASESQMTGSETNRNMFIYKGLSFDIPTGRTAKADTISPCRDGSCDLNILRITTDAKDSKGYSVYTLLKIDLLDSNFKNAGTYIDSFENEQNVLVDQPEKKLVQLGGYSGYGTFMLKIGGVYYLIEIYDFTSEQPMPDGWNDIRLPYADSDPVVMQNVINIIKNIIK